MKKCVCIEDGTMIEILESEILECSCCGFESFDGMEQILELRDSSNSVFLCFRCLEHLFKIFIKFHRLEVKEEWFLFRDSLGGISEKRFIMCYFIKWCMERKKIHVYV